MLSRIISVLSIVALLLASAALAAEPEWCGTTDQDVASIGDISNIKAFAQSQNHTVQMASTSGTPPDGMGLILHLAKDEVEAIESNGGVPSMRMAKLVQRTNEIFKDEGIVIVLKDVVYEDYISGQSARDDLEWFKDQLRDRGLYHSEMPEFRYLVGFNYATKPIAVASGSSIGAIKDTSASNNIGPYEFGGVALAHELGHNMGLYHDHYGDSDRRLGDQEYRRGWMAIKDGSEYFGTVMASGEKLSSVPHFSNPEKTAVHPNDPDQKVYRIGDPEVADAHRWLTEVRADYAAAKPAVAPCQGDPTGGTYFLGDFVAEICWAHTHTGERVEGFAKPSTFWDSSNATSVAFYFFKNQNNQEQLVKLLNACDIDGHYWMFAASATTLEFTITFHDLKTGRSKSWFKEEGVPAPAITDTEAFPCD